MKDRKEVFPGCYEVVETYKAWGILQGGGDCFLSGPYETREEAEEASRFGYEKGHNHFGELIGLFDFKKVYYETEDGLVVKG